ncbi:MAG: hypothetical protein R3E73_12530 [Porticoccaceae bacterium]
MLPMPSTLVLHGQQLELLNIRIDGVELPKNRYRVTADELHID